MVRLQLRPDVHLGVQYSDHSFLASPAGHRMGDALREVFAPLVAHAEGRGFPALVTDLPELMRECMTSAAFQRVAEADSTGGWRVRPEALFPDVTTVRPQRLFVVDPVSERQVSAALPEEYWPLVAQLIADLERGDCDPDDPDLHADVRAVVQMMAQEGLAVPSPARPLAGQDMHATDVTFLGHSCAVVRSGGTRIVVDPVWFPSSPDYPEGYQPLQLRDVGPVDAVLITHSHPDHFGPPSLLRFPPQTRFIVPAVERESLLSVDMALRLRQLGFTNVTSINWGETTRIGDIDVHALPFYGEQPTDGAVLHPEVRNAGNTYLVRTPDFSAVFLADSGRDALGDVREVALEARSAFGPVDLVFCGYRGWSLYPAHYLFSSVPQYLLFVPPPQWDARQQIMARADQALDIAERWGARYLVPYSDGGAPWHWDLGLGPRLDGAGAEMPEFDPFPERVVEAARNRTQSPTLETLASPVQVMLLRPGDSVVDVAGAARLVRVPGHSWPYGDR